MSRHERGSPPKEGFQLHKDFPLMLSVPDSMTEAFESRERQETLIQDSSLHVQVRKDSGTILCLSRAALPVQIAAMRRILEECDEKEEIREVHIYVPADMVAVIIGKRGRQIAKYQDQSKATISVEDKSAPHMPERVITIGGQLRQIQTAIELIHTAVTEHRCYDRERQTTLKMKVTPEEVHHLENWVSTRTEIHLLEEAVVVQGSVRECLIGMNRALELLDNLAPKDNLQVQVLLSRKPDDIKLQLKQLRNEVREGQLEYLVESGDQCHLDIKGQLQERQRTLRMVLEELENTTRGSSKNSRHRSRSRDRRSSSPCILNILVPQEFVGRLIGKAGINVNQMKSQSGCQINFQPHNLRTLRASQGEEARVCTLSGTQKSVAAGTRIVLENVLRLSK